MSLSTAARFLDPASLEQYAQGVSVFPLLGAEEETRLARAARAGDREALDRLVTSHLRFVVDVALTRKDCGPTLSELIEAGNRGLAAFARRWEPDGEERFRTAALRWIRNEMTARVEAA
jgi:RNA polymerase primary sigma factor